MGLVVPFFPGSCAASGRFRSTDALVAINLSFGTPSPARAQPQAADIRSSPR